MGNGLNIPLGQQNKSRTAGAKDKKKRKQRSGGFHELTGVERAEGLTNPNGTPDEWRNDLIKDGYSPSETWELIQTIHRKPEMKSRTTGAKDKKPRKHSAFPSTNDMTSDAKERETFKKENDTSEITDWDTDPRAYPNKKSEGPLDLIGLRSRTVGARDKKKRKQKQGTGQYPGGMSSFTKEKFRADLALGLGQIDRDQHGSMIKEIEQREKKG